ncbi:ribosome maturation factor RimM [Virgibacillus pantothenticus]|uniref:ribosome maturation factor RimM n=1 Tax=Virgibacillus pantothenticus TaxID=1473 RepID=UPI0009846A49|nr:ribosome maturation factor RimM [Virgibacillus pantothenticus]
MTEQMFTVGKIVNTHGIKGEVKVLRITDFDDRFEVGNDVYIIKHGQKPIKMTISSHRVHKGFDLLQFEGYQNINDMIAFKGCELKIPQSQQAELAEHEFYYHEIIGCTMVTQAGEEIGTITEILSPGANDVWVVERKNGKNALIPYIEDVVIDVDVEAKKVTISPMEGLLD